MKQTMTLCTICTLLTIGVCCTATAELIVIKDTGNTVLSDRYLKNVHVPNTEKIMNLISDQKQKLDQKTISANDVGYPDNSVFTPGVVVKHQIKKGFFDTVPLFVIGDDQQSLRWASTNKEYLKNIDAIGIITNVQNKEQTQAVESRLGIKLIATDLKGLDRIIGTKHNRFLIRNGWVEQ